MPIELSRQYADRGAAPLWLEGHVPASLPDAVHRSALVEANAHHALFQLKTVGRFLVEPGEPTVVERAPGATDHDIECFLRGPVAALRLALSGHFALRGAAVDIGGRALALCGVATGTSSLVAALALKGHAVLADGVIFVEGDPPAVAPIPEARPVRVTLWPDAVKVLGLDASSGEIVRPVLSSRAFVLGPPPPGSVPLGVLAALGTSDSPHAVTAPAALTGFSSVATVLKTFWHPRLVEGLGMAKEQFRWAATITELTPTVMLTRRRSETGDLLAQKIKAFMEEVP